MRKYIKYAFIFTMLSGILLYACKNEDTYDWSSVDPGNQKITLLDNDTNKVVLDTIKGNNATTYGYKGIARGGSDYTWTVLSGPVSVEKDATHPFIANIKGDTRIDAYAEVEMTEKTWGGKTASDKIKLFVVAYCPFDFNLLLGNGNFISKNSEYVPYPVSVTQINDNTILESDFFLMGWPLQLVLSKDVEETVQVVSGQTFEYNDELVTVVGKGYYNTCKSLIVLHYAVTRLSGDTIINSDNSLAAGIDSLIKKK